MNKLNFLAASFLLAGCTFSGMENMTVPKVYTAGFESVPTRSYLDSGLKAHWNEKDEISVFNTTYNDRYVFDGHTGDTSGEFHAAETPGPGSALASTYAVYPYSTATSISPDGVISLVIPDRQQYFPDSYAPGTNYMSAICDKGSTELYFQNLCGYVVLYLYGDAVISSIEFRGNGDESLAGPASVSPAPDANPELRMSPEATGCITLDCGDGITIGATQQEATAFWFVIPPVPFNKGFTVTVIDTEGRSLQKSTSAARTVVRNVKNGLAPLEVVFSGQGIPAELISASTSTLAFSWGSDSDASAEWNAALYSDADCTSIVQEFSFPAGTFTEAPRFVFSGLQAGCDYWFKASQPGGKESAVLTARTDDFTIVPVTPATGGTVFAEDFSELRWDGDPVSGACGYLPSDRSDFSNGPGTYVGGNEAPSIPLREQTSALQSSRLQDWVSEMNVSVRPGAIELGSSGKKKGYLMTPQFVMRPGSFITVDVTLKVAAWSNTSTNVWCVAAMDSENVNASGYASDFNHHPTASDKIKHFTTPNPLEWQTVTVKGLRLDSGDRIMVGTKASYPVPQDNDGRLIIGSIEVQATGGMILEDPLCFADGTPVASPSQWPARRQEILDIFQREMYGQMPPASPIYWEKVESGSTTLPALAGYPSAQAIREQYRMWFKPDKSGPSVIWLIIRPADATGPVPVIMTLNYYGNHYLMSDTQVLGPEYRGNAVSGGRGGWIDPSNRYFCPTNLLISRGYALMTADYGDISGDPEPFVASKAYNRVFTLWGERDESRTDNPTALGAWAWGLMRGLDLIGEIEGLDEGKVVVTGASRLGKAALIAGAFDQRFKVVVPIQTGSGGAPLTKHLTPDKESVESETSTYPHWFCKAYYKYAGNEYSMPFDQHMLISCIAPRACLVDGFNHKWFDTEGEYLAVAAASPVWKFLGGSGMPDVTWPATGSTAGIGPDLGYVRRAGTKQADHGMILQDWLWMMDFADNFIR